MHQRVLFGWGIYLWCHDPPLLWGYLKSYSDSDWGIYRLLSATYKYPNQKQDISSMTIDNCKIAWLPGDQWSMESDQIQWEDRDWGQSANWGQLDWFICCCYGLNSWICLVLRVLQQSWCELGILLDHSAGSDLSFCDWSISYMLDNVLCLVDDIGWM